MTRSISIGIGVLLTLGGCISWLQAGESIQDPKTAQEVPTLVPPDPKDLPKSIIRLIDLHNRERAKAELEPLEADARLLSAARKHALDMARRDELEHKGSDDSTMVERSKEEGYRFRFLGENIALGMTTPELAVKSWMNSPNHKKNILNGDYTQVGAATARSKKGRSYWCVVFGTPLVLPKSPTERGRNADPSP